MEEQGAEAGEEEGGLCVQGQAVALHQDGDQHRGAEHGEHVLKAEHNHFACAELAGVINTVLTDFDFRFICHYFSSEASYI